MASEAMDRPSRAAAITTIAPARGNAASAVVTEKAPGETSQHAHRGAQTSASVSISQGRRHQGPPEPLDPAGHRSPFRATAAVRR